MIELLAPRDSEKIMDFLDSTSRENILAFKNVRMLREMIFSSQLVAVGDVDQKGNILRLFAVQSPLNVPWLLYLTIVYMSVDDDDEFVREAINILKDVFSGKYAKIKAFINRNKKDENNDERTISMLERLGFVMEADLKNDSVHLSVYSFFY
ncbi:MAG: hypothetical protein LBJ20_07820 [Candidatus Methanoplasma sp.]|jgi:hypothetical protein|nr:hypothetical protein [Candidatus Methanoplasma sp.]